jgi:hypothetical protein
MATVMDGNSSSSDLYLCEPFSAVSPKKEALEGHLLMFPTRDNNDGCKAQF